MIERDDEKSTITSSKLSSNRGGYQDLGSHMKFTSNIADTIRNNLAKTGLCTLISYRNDDQSNIHGISAVNEHMKILWSKRGAKLSNKENIPVMCCFGAQGQGKTELCRQLVLQKSIELENVDEFICIHVSFSQFTTFNETIESEIPTPQKIVWRVMYNISNFDKYWRYNKTDLISPEDLLDLIRNNASTTIDKSRIAVLFAVDEILKIESNKIRGEILDLFATLQQNELLRSFPTFVMVTSLYHNQVTYHLRTKLGRPVHNILLPFLADQSLNEITEMIVEDLTKAITGSGKDSPEYKKFYCSRELHRTIRIAVSISGIRFRDLELILKSLYRLFVSQEMHERARTLKLSVMSLSGEYDPNKSSTELNDIKLYVDLRNSLLTPSNSLRVLKHHYFFEISFRFKYLY